MDPAADAPDALCARAAATEVVRRLRAAGYRALWAGGCVRDAILGLTPKDYDVATDAEPDAVMALFERSLPVGAQFGVVRVIVGGHELEVARFRAAGPREDAARRDLTINAMLCDPVTGEIFDWFGGREDLRRGIVRAVGDPDARLTEDALRALRVVRFAARFGFAIDPATWAAVARHRERLCEVSVERIRDELERVLTDGGGAAGLGLLDRAGLAAQLLSEVTPVAAAVARFAAAGPTPREPLFGWSLALLDVCGDDIAALGRRLRLPNRLVKDIAASVALARALPGYRTLGVAARKRWVRDPRAAGAVELGRVAASAGEDFCGVEAAAADLGRWPAAQLHPTPLLTGDALRAAGHRPGPAFKVALAALEDAQLAGRASTEADAWRVVSAHLERRPGEA